MDNENKDDDEKNKDNTTILEIDINDTSARKNGTRRARRIRRKHRKQQEKQKKNKLKKIREKIRKYEKLEFYEWVKEFYYKCISIPMIRNQINEKFGSDIGLIILSYLPSIIADDDNLIMKEVIDDDISKTISDSYNDPLKDYYDNNNNNEYNPNVINVMDFYSENGNTSHHTTHSNSIIEDDDDNPLLFMDNNQSNSNSQYNYHYDQATRKNTQSLLDYDDLLYQNNLSKVHDEDTMTTTTATTTTTVTTPIDERNCNTVNLTQLYDDDTNTNNDNDIFELTTS